MQATVQPEGDRLRENIDALAVLLRLAERLRRTNAAKWGITEAEWQAAGQRVADAPGPQQSDAAPVSHAIRAAQSAGRRLSNSGEARFGSARVGRDPDSSHAGKRFNRDLDAAQRRLAELRELVPAEPGAALERPRE